MLQPQLQRPISPLLRVPPRAASHPAATHTSRRRGVCVCGVVLPPLTGTPAPLGGSEGRGTHRNGWHRGGGGRAPPGLPQRPGLSLPRPRPSQAPLPRAPHQARPGSPSGPVHPLSLRVVLVEVGEEQMAAAGVAALTGQVHGGTALATPVRRG